MVFNKIFSYDIHFNLVLIQDINEILTRPAEEFGNDESLEEMWAAKAFEHAEIYFNVIIINQRT